MHSSAIVDFFGLTFIDLNLSFDLGSEQARSRFLKQLSDDVNHPMEEAGVSRPC